MGATRSPSWISGAQLVRLADSLHEAAFSEQLRQSLATQLLGMATSKRSAAQAKFESQRDLARIVVFVGIVLMAIMTLSALGGTAVAALSLIPIALLGALLFWLTGSRALHLPNSPGIAPYELRRMGVGEVVSAEQMAGLTYDEVLGARDLCGKKIVNIFANKLASKFKKIMADGQMKVWEDGLIAIASKHGLVLADVPSDLLLVLSNERIKELRLSHKKDLTVQDTGPALAGGVLAGMMGAALGGGSLAAGAAIGAAWAESQRASRVLVSESWLLDVLTDASEMPVMTMQFDTESAAKTMEAILQIGIR
ncbi:MAG: hypothetical protein KF691_03830 [Phycisphaeraceae bacterium]|nr:hypothetical protein [Phycisphaeraceae bacterium]